MKIITAYKVQGIIFEKIEEALEAEKNSMLFHFAEKLERLTGLDSETCKELLLLHLSDHENICRLIRDFVSAVAVDRPWQNLTLNAVQTKKKQLGIGCTKLARRTGLSESHIAKIIKGDVALTEYTKKMLYQGLFTDGDSEKQMSIDI